MKQNELAKKAKVSIQHVSDLKVGKRTFSKKMSLQFEKVTGIPCYHWMFPEKFGNPWELLKNIETQL